LSSLITKTKEIQSNGQPKSKQQNGISEKSLANAISDAGK